MSMLRDNSTPIKWEKPLPETTRYQSFLAAILRKQVVNKCMCVVKKKIYKDKAKSHPKKSCMDLVKAEPDRMVCVCHNLK